MGGGDRLERTAPPTEAGLFTVRFGYSEPLSSPAPDKEAIPMHNKDLVEQAVTAGQKCYQMALHYDGMHEVKAILYRARRRPETPLLCPR